LELYAGQRGRGVVPVGLDISELALKLLKVPPGGRVNDDGLILSGALHLPDAVTESLQPTPGLGCAEVDNQFVASGVRGCESFPLRGIRNGVGVDFDACWR
jgi:hypothetical protein